MISLGMIAALLMNSLVFPRHSRVSIIFEQFSGFVSLINRLIGLLPVGH